MKQTKDISEQFNLTKNQVAFLALMNEAAKVQPEISYQKIIENKGLIENTLFFDNIEHSEGDIVDWVIELSAMKQEFKQTFFQGKELIEDEFFTISKAAFVNILSSTMAVCTSALYGKSFYPGLMVSAQSGAFDNCARRVLGKFQDH